MNSKKIVVCQKGMFALAVIRVHGYHFLTQRFCRSK
jgi:hypothetical protein